MRLSAKLEFGTVWINDHTPLSSETPHGGFKQSGFGKDLSAEAVAKTSELRATDPNRHSIQCQTVIRP